MMKFFKKNKKGFSLIELIVVIAILGILAVIVVPRISENIERARIVHDRATLRTVQGAVNMFHAQHGRFPGINVGGVVFAPYAAGDLPANYLHLATAVGPTGDITHNLRNFLDLGAAMPLARSRDGTALRTFRYNPVTGAVTIHPPLLILPAD